jgi:hypothetical protein
VFTYDARCIVFKLPARVLRTHVNVIAMKMRILLFLLLAVVSTIDLNHNAVTVPPNIHFKVALFSLSLLEKKQKE